MGQDDIVKIDVGKNKVGVVGLKQVLEETAMGFPKKGDEEVRSELLERLSQKNYIPPGAKQDYGDALLREFNKHLGRPYEEVPTEGLDIKILGPGCDRCDTLEKMVMEVLEETGIGARVEHIKDIREISRYGVMGPPALVINEKVVSVGSVPTKGKIINWLREPE